MGTLGRLGCLAPLGVRFADFAAAPALPSMHRDLPVLIMEMLGQNVSQLRRSLPEKRFSLSTAVSVGVKVRVVSGHGRARARWCSRAVPARRADAGVRQALPPSWFLAPRREAWKLCVWAGVGGRARCRLHTALACPLTRSLVSRSCCCSDNSDKLYLLDFGLTRLHLDSSGKPKPPRARADFRGTSVYASLHAHKHMVRACRHCCCHPCHPCPGCPRRLIAQRARACLHRS